MSLAQLVVHYIFKSRRSVTTQSLNSSMNEIDERVTRRIQVLAGHPPKLWKLFTRFTRNTPPCFLRYIFLHCSQSENMRKIGKQEIFVRSAGW